MASLILDAGCGDDGGGGTAGLELTAGESVSATITAAEGGSITVGAVTFDVPPGALAVDTEISITPFAVGDATLALRFEPEGLVFLQPATAHFAITATDTARLASEHTDVVAVPLLFGADGKAEVPNHGWTIDGDARLNMAMAIPHFSTLILVLAPGNFFGFDSVSQPAPRYLGVGPVYTDQAKLAMPPLISGSSVLRLEGTFEGQGGFPVSWYTQQFTLGFVAIEFVEGTAHVTRTISSRTLEPLIAMPDFGSYPPNQQLVAMNYRCDGAGTGWLEYDVEAHVAGTLGINITSIEGTRSRTLVLTEKQQFALAATDVAGVARRYVDPLNCVVDAPHILDTLEIAGDTAALAEFFQGYKTIVPPACYPHSNGGVCHDPESAQRLLTVLDPLITVGPVAATRMEASLPCGDGPVGKTLCGTAGAFAEGDYVMLAATLDAPPLLADPVGVYQTAFVFDADGIASNNYVASPQYPKDYFAGTDLWYEAKYTPAGGWVLKVTDVRLNFQQVASAARFVIAGQEIAIFVPRDELGANPSFRVSTFRHTGDYGLQGGPWELSYAPLLDAPLYPAASGTPIVLPE